MQSGQIQHRKSPLAAPSSSGRPDAEVQRSSLDDTSEASTSGKSDGIGDIALDSNPVSQVESFSFHKACQRPGQCLLVIQIIPVILSTCLSSRQAIVLLSIRAYKSARNPTLPTM